MFDIKACRMTSLDQFFDDFLNFKISKDRDHSVSDPAKKRSGLHSVKFSPVSGIFPVFETGPLLLSYFGRVPQVF